MPGSGLGSGSGKVLAAFFEYPHQEGSAIRVSLGKTYRLKVKLDLRTEVVAADFADANLTFSDGDYALTRRVSSCSMAARKVNSQKKAEAREKDKLSHCSF